MEKFEARKAKRARNRGTCPEDDGQDSNQAKPSRRSKPSLSERKPGGRSGRAGCRTNGRSPSTTFQVIHLHSTPRPLPPLVKLQIKRPKCTASYRGTAPAEIPSSSGTGSYARAQISVGWFVRSSAHASTSMLASRTLASLFHRDLVRQMRARRACTGTTPVNSRTPIIH